MNPYETPYEWVLIDGKEALLKTINDLWEMIR